MITIETRNEIQHQDHWRKRDRETERERGKEKAKAMSFTQNYLVWKGKRISHNKQSGTNDFSIGVSQKALQSNENTCTHPRTVSTVNME